MSRVTRVLICLAVLFIVFVITLYWIGGRQRQYNSQVVIAAPKQLVFKFLTDPDMIRRWSSNAAQIRPLTEGGHQQGARSHISVGINGLKMEIDSEVLESLPDERLITALISSQMNARSDFQLSENLGKTTVTHSLLVSPRGMSRLFAPFSGRQIQEQLDTGLNNLREIIENEVQQLPSTTTPIE